MEVRAVTKFTGVSPQKTRLVLHMGAGDDDMVGGRLGDLLDGGAGDDFAFGHGGRDTCLAEEAYECETVG